MSRARPRRALRPERHLHAKEAGVRALLVAMHRILMDQYCATDCTPTADDLHRAFYHYLRTGHDLLLGAAGPGSGIR